MYTESLKLLGMDKENIKNTFREEIVLQRVFHDDTPQGVGWELGDTADRRSRGKRALELPRDHRRTAQVEQERSRALQVEPRPQETWNATLKSMNIILKVLELQEIRG